MADLKRILFGVAPPEFMLEVFIHTLIIYIALLFIVRALGKRMSGQLTIMEMAVMLTIGVYIELVTRESVFYLLLLVAIRLMGKRMSSQLSRNDLAAMVSLTAAMGVPLQAPDRGIIPAIIIAFIIVFTARRVAAKSFKSQDFERFSQGNIGMLVKDSVLDLAMMKKVRISRERFVAQLRSKNIKQLGSVKRFYMEASGSFTLIQEENVKPGLSILPHWDKDFNASFKKIK